MTTNDKENRKAKAGRFDCADPSPDKTLTSPVSNGGVFAAVGEALGKRAIAT